MNRRSTARQGCDVAASIHSQFGGTGPRKAADLIPLHHFLASVSGADELPVMRASGGSGPDTGTIGAGNDGKSGRAGASASAPYPRHDTAAEFAEFIAHNRREFLAERLPNETGPEWLARTNRGGRYL